MTAKTVQIAGISVQLTRKAVKNINLRVSRKGRVNVSYPWHTSEAAAIAFVESNSDWIRTALSRASLLGEKNPQAPAPIASGHTVSVWGHPYNLRIIHGSKRTARIFEHDVIITLPNRYLDDLTSETSQRAIRKTFDEFLAQEIRAVLPELLATFYPNWKEVRASLKGARPSLR